MRSRLIIAFVLLIGVPVSAQDLDPRAYTYVPVNGTFVSAGFSHSRGEVLADATLPLVDETGRVETMSIGLARTFSLFGRTAQAFGVVPYSWAYTSSTKPGAVVDTTRTGLSDMRLRVSVLLRGGRAASPLEIAKAPRRTILGTSLSVNAPIGQFASDKLINLGTNRWAFKPEFAVSQPLGERWLLEGYAALWTFTGNDSFYPGTSSLTQAPIGALQLHLIYEFQRRVWAALDATYYVGGRTTINGFEAEDRQSNSRIGGTVVLPIGRQHSLKLAVSRGAYIRYGPDFSTFSIGWQTAWVGKR